jgi:hypothetical protein
MASPKDLLRSKAVKLKAIKQHPGMILVIGKDKDVYVVNVFKMIVLKQLIFENDGCIGCVIRDKNLVICGMLTDINLYFRLHW